MIFIQQIEKLLELVGAFHFDFWGTALMNLHPKKSCPSSMGRPVINQKLMLHTGTFDRKKTTEPGELAAFLSVMPQSFSSAFSRTSLADPKPSAGS